MSRSARPTAFLSPEERARVEAAVAAAELDTSGEIRVVISRRVKGDALDAALGVFRRLKMHETRERNGVLILLAAASRTFAILGDEGIHRFVGPEGWAHLRDGMAERFARDDFGAGLAYAVEEVGRVLRQHFPRREDDRDELPNQIVEE